MIESFMDYSKNKYDDHPRGGIVPSATSMSHRQIKYFIYYVSRNVLINFHILNCFIKFDIFTLILLAFFSCLQKCLSRDGNLQNMQCHFSWIPGKFLKEGFDKDFDAESNQLVCWGRCRKEN